MSQTKLTLAELKKAFRTDFEILVVKAWGDDLISARGKPYSVVVVEYTVLGEKDTQKYQAATFTAIGKLIINTIEEGEIYRIETAVSDRGYEEWVDIKHV